MTWAQATVEKKETRTAVRPNDCGNAITIASGDVWVTDVSKMPEKGKGFAEEDYFLSRAKAMVLHSSCGERLEVSFPARLYQ